MTKPKRLMHDGRAHVEAEMDANGFITVKGKRLSNHDAVKLTGKTLMMIRDRLYKQNMTLDEAINSPVAQGDSRIGPTTLATWLEDYRAWLKGEAPEPEPPTPAPNHLPVAQHRFKLEVQAEAPADIADLRIRMDRIEKLLTDLVREWQGNRPA